MTNQTVKKAFQTALQQAQENRLVEAESTLNGILEIDPDEVNALRMLGALCLSQRRISEAETLLSRTVDLAPDFAVAVLELAKARHLSTGSDKKSLALSGLRSFLDRHPEHSNAWQLYADLSFATGQADQGRVAQRRAIETDPHNNKIGSAVAALSAGKPREAEENYRSILRENPNNVHALVGLASMALDREVISDAQRLLDHALAQSAYYSHVQRARARLFMKQGLYEAAEEAAVRATELAPGAAECWTSLGTIYGWGLKQELAAAAFERALELNPDQPRVHLSLGHTRKALGAHAQSVAAYRAAIEQDQLLGEAWWSLADLKTYRFTPQETSRMGQLLGDPGMAERQRDQAALHFAYAKAAEDREDYDVAYNHYRQGNSLRAQHESFNLARFRNQIESAASTFTQEFWLGRSIPRMPRRSRIPGTPRMPRPRENESGVADETPVPIFVIGLPRSGSTLVDQILSSHSQIQGTMELPHILGYVRELGHDLDSEVAPDVELKDQSSYPGCVAQMTTEALTDLGRRYLRETAAYHQGAAFFVDKMPNNFLHLGLISLMLPRAVFVDTRRHPMGCCFSIFKQNFARGQAFGYSEKTLGGYYQGYLDLMRHWQHVLPGRIHRVVYEDLVDNPEPEIRRLLAHCGVPFESACLRFHETQRVVRTASAEQVRQPIFTSGKEQWRNFDPYLGELKHALGDTVRTWKTDFR